MSAGRGVWRSASLILSSTGLIALTLKSEQSDLLHKGSDAPLEQADPSGEMQQQRSGENHPAEEQRAAGNGAPDQMCQFDQ
jgi:hypothetical protein